MQTRQDLLYLLAQASEIEHSLAVQYLYAAFSLKTRREAGISDDQAAVVEKWRSSIIGIAIQEMLHLGLVCNLLTAIGGAPYLRRANFPQGKMYSTLGLDFRLAGVSEKTIKRFCCFELPPKLNEDSVYASWKCTCARLVSTDRQLSFDPDSLLPQMFNYTSIGELYELIENGFKELYPEDASKLFIGLPASQTESMWKTMTKVTNRVEASTAIDLIVRQGEGAYGCDEEIAQAHFGQFVKIYDDLVSGAGGSEPAFNVVENPALVFHYDMEYKIGDEDLKPTIITSSIAREANEVFVSLYELALQLLLRYFANSEENDEQRYVLKQAFLSIMRYCVTSLGMAIARLPAFLSCDDGPRAGASFEFYSDTLLLPHLNSAWLFFEERFREVSEAASALATSPDSEPYPMLRTALSGDNTPQRPGVVEVCSKYIAGISSGRSAPGVWTWENGVRAFFSPVDIEIMARHGIDLSSEEDVLRKKDIISFRIGTGPEGSVRMPPQFLLEDESPGASGYRNPNGPWTERRIEVFREWAGVMEPIIFECPDPLTWEDGVKNFFTERDVRCMIGFGFDLSKYEDVVLNLDLIAVRIESKSMPPGGGWPDEQIKCFLEWKDLGAPEGKRFIWRRTSTLRASSRYDDVFFINRNVGWAVNSNAQVVHTKDSGVTWDVIATIVSDDDRPIYLRCCWFLDENVGYIGTVSGSDRIFVTNDGGFTWTPFRNLSKAAPLKICGMTALTKDIVYCTGTNDPDDFAAFTKTIDGGKTWTGLSMESEASILIDNYFWDELRGITVGGYTDVPRGQRTRADVHPVILKTEDGGETWFNLLQDFTSLYPKGEWGWKICVVNEDIIYVALENFTEGAIAKTTDGGKTWTRLPVEDGQGKDGKGNANLEGIGFIDEKKGWVGGWGDINFQGGYTSATNNGGDTWTAATDTVGRFINRFRFLGDPVDLGFASGDYIYKYSSDTEADAARVATIEAREIETSLILTPREAFRLPLPVIMRINVPPGSKKLRVHLWNHFGNFVRTLVSEEMPAAGERKIMWDGTNEKGKLLEADGYIYRVSVDDLVESRIIFAEV